MKAHKPLRATLRTCWLLCTALCLSLSALAQKPEKQKSFAQESKPHAYYVQQAELWWKEVEKDKKSEDNWYNYFRACRNAHGTANWKTDFVKESPYLRLGNDIVKLMEKHIPSTFMYNYLSYLDGGISPENGPKLLKAYAMNPDFEGIHSSMVSYAYSRHDTALQRRVNRAWHRRNEQSLGMMNYAYNALMSLEPNAVLLCQSDNDTYPALMLQDVLGIRQDVYVLNIDFLLLPDFRDTVFRKLGVPAMKLTLKGHFVNDYELNWQKVVHHILGNYTGKRPIHLGLTLFPELYEKFSGKLQLSGLSYRFTEDSLFADELNRRLYENVFLLDNLRRPLAQDRNETNALLQDLNYLHMLNFLYKSYRKDDPSKAREVRELALDITRRTGNEEWVEQVSQGFGD